MSERTTIAPEGRQEPANAEHFRADAGAADTASNKERLAVGLADESVERNLRRGVANRIDEPAKSGPGQPRKHGKSAALQANNRRCRHLRHPLRARASHQARPHSDELGGPNEIEFVGFPIAEREFSLKPQGIGSNAVICGYPAECTQAWVERRRVTGRRGGLFHTYGYSPVGPNNCRPARLRMSVRVPARTLPPASRKRL